MCVLMVARYVECAASRRSVASGSGAGRWLGVAVGEESGEQESAAGEPDLWEIADNIGELLLEPRLSALDEGRRDEMRRYRDRSDVEWTTDDEMFTVSDLAAPGLAWLSEGGELLWRVGVMGEAAEEKSATREAEWARVRLRLCGERVDASGDLSTEAGDVEEPAHDTSSSTALMSS